MTSPVTPQAARREACAATLYGLGAVYRHDDAFDATLVAIGAWAESLDAYDTATIDVFTGTDYLTLVGPAQDRTALDQVHRTIARHPGRRFHVLDALAPRIPSTARPAPAPGSWLGATLFSSNGAVLGCLSLWSAAPVAHLDSTRERLPLLARATMDTLEERRRVWNSRAVVAPGPRVVITRLAGRPV